MQKYTNNKYIEHSREELNRVWMEHTEQTPLEMKIHRYIFANTHIHKYTNKKIWNTAGRRITGCGW